MRKSRSTEAQIIGFITQSEAGLPIKELCRKRHACAQLCGQPDLAHRAAQGRSPQVLGASMTSVQSSCVVHGRNLLKMKPLLSCAMWQV